MLSYKPNAASVMERLRALYARQASDRIFATTAIPSPTLAAFAAAHAAGYCDCPDPAERAAFWDALLRESALLDDDSIPSAYLSEMDQGIYGAVLGARIQFMVDPATGWISSMVPPLLDDWSGFERLRFDPAHPWFARYRRQMEVFLQRASGKFAVSHFILIDSLNFAFELVGATKTYLALDEHPDVLRRVIDFAFDLNVAIQQAFFDTVPLLGGGTASNMVQWMPGRIVSESVDPFHMTSVRHFEQWGREPIQRMFARFDGGVAHIHGNGRHLIEAVSTLRGLKAVFLGDDKGFPLAFDVLPTIRARAGDLPLVVSCPYQSFCDRLKHRQLPGGVLYRVQDVPDAASANRLMDLVRAYRTDA